MPCGLSKQRSCGSFSTPLRKRLQGAERKAAKLRSIRRGRGSKVLEPGDDIAEDLFRDGFFDIAVFCGSTRLGVLDEAGVFFVEAPLRLPPVGGGG